MKKIIYIIILNSVNTLIAQVGINTKLPNVTLEVKSEPSNPVRPDGIIAPQMSKAILISKENNYTINHKGTFLYINEINNSTSPKTININNTGYYYYDGTVWKKFIEPQKYFYLPAFIQDIQQIGNNFELDIYNDIYIDQLTKQNNNQFLSNNSFLNNVQLKNDLTEYSNTDFDYVITHYDNTLIEINGISPEGILSYNIISTEISLSSFINIVLVVK